MPEKEFENTKLSAMVEPFFDYAKAELCLAEQTIAKYRDCLRQVVRILGDRPVVSYQQTDVLRLKADMLGRHLSVGRQVSILAALKALLSYARSQRGLPCLDPAAISFPKRPRREVNFLTPVEVERFVESIKLYNTDGGIIMAGLRFRTLVEVLLGSAMRISEVLSLDRSGIDFASREARIIGKGNKERAVFFTLRALEWVQRYLQARTDIHPALFVTQTGEARLSRPDIWRPFARCAKLACLAKRVTPHLLRHTAATQLLFNGCPVGHIKEILGHERLETTCRYYLGLDRRAAKAALHRYLVYEPSPHPEERPAMNGAPFQHLPQRLLIHTQIVPRRRLNILVPCQLFNKGNVGAMMQQRCAKSVPK
jgi:integrase/recombinase XerD